MNNEDFKILLKDALAKLNAIYDKRESTSILKWLLFDKYGIDLDTIESVDLDRGSFLKDLSELQIGRPLQHITGFMEFMNLRIAVNEHVLIPRPETEELCTLAINENKNEDQLKILDIGTGSGCIALALKKHLPYSAVTAIDISEKALELAEENAKRINLDIAFLNLDILNTDVGLHQEFDIIISNPPYIPISEKEAIHVNVKDFEPSNALFVKDKDPLEFYRAILEFCEAHLKNRGKIYFEIHPQYSSELIDLVKQYPFGHVALLRDLQGKNRILKAKKNGIKR